jgi:hypothetical protein
MNNFEENPMRRCAWVVLEDIFMGYLPCRGGLISRANKKI